MFSPLPLGHCRRRADNQGSTPLPSPHHTAPVARREETMDRTGSETSATAMESADASHGRSSPPRHRPNYNSTIVQDALEHLASIDLFELCNESKIERCRATRDLSSCGRYVQHVLNSCGHASLCAECSQRCDACPICRSSIPNSGSRVQLRLYYKCIEAGLISKRHDERFQEKEDTGEYLLADIQRLYSLFDVALENNLASLICHYITDICMDESAVSSDPVLAFLLDEVVVKDWCKRTFKNIVDDLHGIYSCGMEAMKSKPCLFQKFAFQLTGISNVLEVMNSSFKGTFSAQLQDLHHLLENILKVKQHLNVMTWCARHQFLEGIQPHYPNFTLWNFHVHERKSAALKRSWPDTTSNLVDPSPYGSSLFIEQALLNLGIEQSCVDKEKEELDIFCLQDINSPLGFESLIDVADKNIAAGCYPFETLRVAADILFLHGTSDMVVAKHAIFLYYLFDRHWTRPDVEWRHLIDDFAASFGLSRHLVLESLVFYLLDDHTDQALQESTRILPEIASPQTHPKIAQVLLERQCPDIALTILRCTGRDSFCSRVENDGLQCVSLGEAVTAVRVRIECGLLTEAFMYQRMRCSKVKEEISGHGSSTELSNKTNSDSWIHQVEILVTEICYLCIRRNLVDRMIELPWDSDEEKYIHKCLLGHAFQDPSSIYGSLLVVFYLQRYRYIEAYQVDRKLRNEEKSVSESANMDIVSKITSISQWRTKLVDNCIKLLPEVQRVQLMSGDIAADNDPLLPSQDIQMSYEVNLSNVTPNCVTTGTASAISKTTPSFLLQQHRLLTLGTPMARMNFAADRISSSNLHNGDQSSSDRSRTPQSGSQNMPLKELNRSSSKQFQAGKNSPFERVELFDIAGHAENSHPFVPGATTNEDAGGDVMDTPRTNNGYLSESVSDHKLMISKRQNQLGRPWSKVLSEEANMNSWSFGKSDSSNIQDAHINGGGSRWRSDESSEEDELNLPGPFGYTTTPSSRPVVRRGRARFSRR